MRSSTVGFQAPAPSVGCRMDRVFPCRQPWLMRSLSCRLPFILFPVFPVFPVFSVFSVFLCVRVFFVICNFGSPSKSCRDTFFPSFALSSRVSTNASPQTLICAWQLLRKISTVSGSRAQGASFLLLVCAQEIVDGQCITYIYCAILVPWAATRRPGELREVCP